MKTLRGKPAFVVSGLVFEGMWLVCVLAPGMLIVAGLTLANVLLHRALMADWSRQAVVVAAVFVSGVAMDFFLYALGILIRHDGQWGLPYWHVLLWINFALALGFAFPFLQGRVALASLVGAIAGPLSYLAGSAVGGEVSLASPSVVWVPVMALIWACYLGGWAYWAPRDVLPAAL